MVPIPQGYRGLQGKDGRIAAIPRVVGAWKAGMGEWCDYPWLQETDVGMVADTSCS